MDSGLKLLSQLMPHLEAFCAQGKNGSLKEFSVFLMNRVEDSGKEKTGKDGFDPGDYRKYREFPEIEFSVLLTGLNRFGQHYLKKVFRNTAFKTIDEFGFMATLMREGSMTKGKLIARHRLGVSSGSEIIRRLIRQQLIREYPDERDLRSVRVEISGKGRKELMSAFGEMYKLSRIISGNLTRNERDEVLRALRKLSGFHEEIHEKDQESGVDEIMEKYLTQ